MFTRLEKKDLQNANWLFNHRILRLVSRENFKLTPLMAEKIERAEGASTERRTVMQIYTYLFAFKHSGFPLQSLHYQLYSE